MPVGISAARGGLVWCHEPVPFSKTATGRPAAAAALVLLGTTLITGCGDQAEGGSSTGGPWMQMSVAVCVAEDAGLPESATVEVQQDGNVVGSMGAGGSPTWSEVSTRSGAVEVLADGEVLEEQTGEPGDRPVFALGD